CWCPPGRWPAPTGAPSTRGSACSPGRPSHWPPGRCGASRTTTAPRGRPPSTWRRPAASSAFLTGSASPSTRCTARRPRRHLPADTPGASERPSPTNARDGARLTFRALPRSLSSRFPRNELMPSSAPLPPAPASPSPGSPSPATTSGRRSGTADAPRVQRRTFLSGTAAVGGAFAVTAAGVSPALAAEPVRAGGTRGAGPVTVRPNDRRYADLRRGTNQRWVGSPQKIVLAATTADVGAAVQRAVDSGRRLAVRSGGHCYEDFTTSQDIEIVLDLSRMDDVSYDRRRRAFSVQPGAPLGRIYDRLYKGWGVYLPAGNCPTVAAGGHIQGGGYGSMSRRDGLAVDHLYGIEIVVVRADGTARTVVATREPDDPHRELWWAHTGGGGGNFGVVTRYWLRSPGATGTDPAAQLPTPPREVWLSEVAWPWERLSEARFTRL